MHLKMFHKKYYRTSRFLPSFHHINDPQNNEKPVLISANAETFNTNNTVKTIIALFIFGPPFTPIR